MSLSGLRAAIRRRSAAAVAVAASAVLLQACSAVPLPEAHNGIDLGGELAFSLPVESMIGRRFETVVRQQYDFSCGSAALATLLRFHYDDPQSEQSVFLGMFRDGDRAQIRKLGFSLLDMKRYLAGRHISADGYHVSIEQIMKAQTPGIALINFEGYSHFVVVKGFDRQTLILGDPSLGLRREDIKTFVKQWNGVYFVLNGRTEVAKSHFGQVRDRERVPGPPDFWSYDPLDLAALALTRPLPNEL